MRTDVLGVAFDNVTKEEAVGRAMALLEEQGCHLVATPNPEIIQMARRDAVFSRVLAGAALVLADGIGVVLAARILGRSLKGRVPGIDFAAALMERLAETDKRLFLLGARPGVAEEAAQKLSVQYPGLTICGTHDGYFQQDGPVVETIRAARADVVFVCLGAPRQEKWAAEHGPATGARLFAGLGGSLDVFAGRVKRAPVLFQRLGLEWLFRLFREPSRIGRMVKLPLILGQAVLERWKEQRGEKTNGR